MLRYIALLALVAGASAHFIMPKCPPVPGKFPFDMQKFQGDWYMTGASDVIVEKMGKCGKLSFPAYAKDDKIEETVLNTRFTGVSTKDGSPIAYEIFLQPMMSDKIANMHFVSRPEGTSTFGPIFKVAIVSSDYTNYALFVACKAFFNTETKKFERALTGEIWTREGVTLSQDTYNALTTQLSSYDIDPATIKPIEKC